MILVQLLGHEPPPDFKGDGLTWVPDLWFAPAGRRHDYGYALIREMISEHVALRTAMRRLLWGSPERHAAKDEVKSLSIQIKARKLEEDLWFKENMRRLSRGSASRVAAGFVIGWGYHRGVRRFGGVFGLRVRNKATRPL